MTHHICKICGGSVELEDDAASFICPYCKTEQFLKEPQKEEPKSAPPQKKAAMGIDAYDRLKSEVKSLSENWDSWQKKAQNLQNQYESAQAKVAEYRKKVKVLNICQALSIISYIIGGFCCVLVFVFTAILDDVDLRIGIISLVSALFGLVTSLILWAIPIGLCRPYKESYSTEKFSVWREIKKINDYKSQASESARKGEQIYAELENANRQAEICRALLNEKTREMDKFLMGL